MTTTNWSREKIREFKESCYPFRDQPFVEEKLCELNLHISRYERATLIHEKSSEWKEVEKIANEMSEQLHSLN